MSPLFSSYLHDFIRLLISVHNQNNVAWIYSFQKKKEALQLQLRDKFIGTLSVLDR